MEAKKKAKAAKKASENSNEQTNEPDDIDEEEGDDEDNELRQLREQRLRHLKAKQMETLENIGRGHGQYREITQDEFLAEVTSSVHVICHFYHKDFPRCEIMNMHLAKLVQKHIETKFIKINAEKAPFFVEKVSSLVITEFVVCGG